MFKIILAPTDGSSAAQKAVEAAADLAQRLNAKLVILSVIDPAQRDYSFAELETGAYKALRNEATQITIDAAASVADTCQAVTMIGEGAPVSEILDAAKTTNAELIVMGTHGRTGLDHLVMGSVAEGVLRNAKIPVMTIRSRRVAHAHNR